MKKKQFLSEIRQLSVEDLKKRASEIADSQMRMRFQNTLGQLEKSHQLGEQKAQLAQIFTVLREKRQEADSSQG